MLTVDTSKPVMVTGATGYVAGRIVERLLAAGLTVHAPIRNPNDPEKRKHLDAVAETTPGTIRYFEADLLDEGSYAEAMAGCRIVFHTASPFKVKAADPLKELVEPARFGTRNVLQQAKRTPTVTRVVLTSSCVAIYGDNVDLAQTPNGVFDEDVWNTTSSLTHQPYNYSKTMAEREAWSIAGTQDQWDLVTINPTLIIGPGLNPFATSESLNVIAQLGDGTLKSGAPRWGLGLVDIRDVAEAHFRAAFTPEARGRYLIHGHDTDFLGMAEILAPAYGKDYPIPRKAVPKWLIWLLAPIINPVMTRKGVALNVGFPWKGDNGKSIRDLGMTYRPLAESLDDFFRQLIDSGRLPKPAR